MIRGSYNYNHLVLGVRKWLLRVVSVVSLGTQVIKKFTANTVGVLGCCEFAMALRDWQLSRAL